ncbi:hypothetical protein N7468_003501 [Penicillium chermesinum]|uniref:Dynein light intermediate chain n=1 Tax=Penicillium chermesinum TaxID=63820 RepID=A0A9W9TRV5_9EURO|nr:uncharacterized protein N7468_003501 [Penicillium chermesinum]KAJ5238882.1 hypothetical protein N7468_003501 [Penicillium chermesinum]
MVGLEQTMSSSPNRGSKTPGANSRPSSKDGKKNIWSSLLDGAANGKRLPEKNLLILGGTPESQREFLETLSANTEADPSLVHDRRKGKTPPIANQFALGYTYQDVLDADQEDTLARVSAYLLSEPSPSFAPLLKPLLTPQSVPETLAVILLDWSDPWLWIRQLREWVRLLRSVLVSLDDDTKIVMEETMTDWRDRKRGVDGNSAAAGSFSNSGGPVTIPLGPGEWDEGLGIPMCVVCQGADKIEKLEKDHGWHEEQFDFILQFLRTILLKREYPSSYLSSKFNPLLLGIHSLLKRQSLKHNVIDRDKIIVPANWDSWGKIRIIREGFDMEGVSTAWSIEIQDPPEPLSKARNAASESENSNPAEDGTSAVTVFEQTIKDPKIARSIIPPGTGQGNEIDIETPDMQEFLSQQKEKLEQLKAEDAKDRSTQQVPQLEMSPMDDQGRVNEHIGPVQFNMGGIQVDADDMLKKLRPIAPSRVSEKDTGVSATPGDEKAHNQALASFFAGLVKKPGSSPRGSPSS